MLIKLVCLSVVVVPAVAVADDGDPDDAAAVPPAALAGAAGGGFHLFRPVPDDQQRPFAIDDTPHTIDAGHVQAEIDLAVVGYDRRSEAKTVAAAFMPTRLRVGLTEAVEAQLVVVPYRTTRTEQAGEVTTAGGYGSTSARLKIALVGNDAGRVAVALAPSIGRAGDAWAGGVAVPIAITAGAGLTIVLVPQVDATAEDLTATAAAYVSRVVWGPVMGIADTAWKVSRTPDVPTAGQLNATIAVAVTADAEVDVGARRGLTGDVADLEGFVRISVRR